MSITLRILLVVVAVFVAVFVVSNIRKSRMRIEDSIFWICLATVVLVLSVFPQIGFAVSSALGFIAPVNFVFAFFILVLVAKCLQMSCHISDLECKLRDLAQQMAINQFHEDRAVRQDDEEARGQSSR